MKTIPSLRHAPRAGYSLIVTLVLTGVATVVLAATLQRTVTTSKLNDRTDAYMVAMSAAEAATEKVMSKMALDFANGGEVSLSNNLSYYQSSLLPNTNENPFWANFQFSDGQGNANKIYVARITTNPNPPYVTLLQQYPGLSAFASTYRVLSNVKFTNSDYGFVAAVDQDLQMAEIPVFQFAIFYNTLMEYSDCAPFDINGRVHCNSNIYVGTISGSHLTFNYFVTCGGTITNPAWAGFAKSSWQGPITYNGTPAPGYGTGEPILTLPVGTNNTPAAVREIINPPPFGESVTNPVSSQRYYNKAYMLITITNPSASYSAGTNSCTATNWSVRITIKNSMYDASPTQIYLGANTNTNNPNSTNWVNTGVTNWLNTNVTFFDYRENRTCRATQIDLGALGSWMGNVTGGVSVFTNTNATAKWTLTTPFNGVLYIQDVRDTNSSFMDCVRLNNGANIANGLYTSGLTVATQNPLYIWGIYNCPNALFQGTTNTTLSRPCSVACDALTILSPAWLDGLDTSALNITAANDTVNTAIIAGNVLSTDATSTGFSGGVMNLTRLLENWSGKTLTLNSSIINLYNSVQATKQFQMPGIYYNAPSRKFSFDLNFTASTGLPPGTPLVNRMIRASWCNPQPNNIAFTNPPQLFVPH